MLEIVTNLFNSNNRNMKALKKLVSEIEAKKPEMAEKSFEDFQNRTSEIKQMLSAQENRSFESDSVLLEQLLPETFAMIREAAGRIIGEFTFEEQLMVGIVLHQGGLAEQKTGEGKTHAAVHPTYLNALTGRGAHVVTVNDYLARRDAEWMGPIYHMMGLSVGVINSQNQSFIYEPPIEVSEAAFPLSEEYKNNTGTGKYLKEVTRREAYQCDITYGTNNEFGFDYLRDNMVQKFDQVVQTNALGEFGAHHFVIVDEADSILIDEARTPLIISAPAEESNELYQRLANIFKSLDKGNYDKEAKKVIDGDYAVDEKTKNGIISDIGWKKIAKSLGIEEDVLHSDPSRKFHAQRAADSYAYERDKDYVVKDGEVLIVDSFTGRLMPGRRYSEGLHQALEAKEGVAIQKESKTLATITFQNYFRLYQKLSGMSATIMTEAEEFFKIYELESIAIPTHRPVARVDHSDRIYKHQRAKWKAIVDEIEEINKIGQPILAGTTSVENNELLSNLLKRRSIKHELLNAKNHLREADIVAKAGQKGAVTIATNMAGRGTDIKLGQGVKELGGLHVIGTERHEARRIDNQLRGRSGRQGDPGSSRFFVALDDDLMRIFNGDKIAGLMTRFNLPEDMPIEANIVSKSIENSQKKVESYNFDIRKHLVEYDDVINKQREIIYERRRRLLRASDGDSTSQANIKQQLIDIMVNYARQLLTAAMANPETDIQEVVNELDAFLSLNASDKTSLKEIIDKIGATHDTESVISELVSFIEYRYEAQEKALGNDQMRQIERVILLSTIDYYWMEHIDALDELRYGVRLRAYGQRDPLVEFKNEAFRMFSELLAEIDYEVIHRLFKVKLAQPVPQTSEILDEAQTEHKQIGQFQVDRAEASSRSEETNTDEGHTHEPTVKSEEEKIGRNDPCWCGSGKKYKHCHYPELPA
ncbi:preprotein translocase subunit SecA [candidate division WWE3 bacterium]|uniref:Protein translocase subunit SecA n=1 Tax=candidate division WWE3 bacterium TaxID=2053526 RepID=A0A955LI02_UNCKA|nr:preprotein translocase subunit SecA [candidate division WWE3 bacterium]